MKTNLKNKIKIIKLNFVFNLLVSVLISYNKISLSKHEFNPTAKHVYMVVSIKTIKKKQSTENN